MAATWRGAVALLRGKTPGAYPHERAMLWAVVIVQAAGITVIGYLTVRSIIAGWP